MTIQEVEAAVLTMLANKSRAKGFCLELQAICNRSEGRFTSVNGTVTDSGLWQGLSRQEDAIYEMLKFEVSINE